MAADAKSIAVLGAGVTSLVATHRLAKEGHAVRIFEQSNRAGEPALAQLVRELDLTESIVRANPLAKNRYLFRGDRLIPVPLLPSAFLVSHACGPT